MKRSLVFVSTMAALAACQPIPGPVPPAPDADSSAPPAPQPDASIPPTPPTPPVKDAAPDLIIAGTACQQACAVLAWLGCPEGTPTPKGETCDVTCTKSQAVPNIALPTSCVARARTIADVRRCTGVTCR
jgi:hypothetical protein